MFNRILIPLDGSDHSIKMIGWATGLAKALQAEMVLLNVIDPEDLAFLESASGLSSVSGNGMQDTSQVELAISDAESKATSALKNIAESVDAPEVKIRTHVEIGSPAETIVRTAVSSSSDLIAMATRRESALVRGVLGSVTDRVLHSSSIPLLTLYPGDIAGFDDNHGVPTHIIVPLDGSELSESAIPTAMELAKAANAELRFFETIRTSFVGAGITGLEYGAGDFAGDAVVNNRRANAEKYLDDWVSFAQEQGVNSSRVVSVGSPAQKIVDQANQVEGSIVVMGSHGSGGLKRWVVGSVADKVIRSAHRPVLVIPPKTG